MQLYDLLILIYHVYIDSKTYETSFLVVNSNWKNNSFLNYINNINKMNFLLYKPSIIVNICLFLYIFDHFLRCGLNFFGFFENCYCLNLQKQLSIRLKYFAS